MFTKNIRSILLAVLSVATLSSCGSSGVTGNEITMPQDSNPVPTPTPSNTGTGGTPALPFSFSVYGNNPSATTTSIQTDNLLSVQITAGAAGVNYGGGTNFAAEYHCAIYSVTLQMKQSNGTWLSLATQTTSPLTVPGTSGCQNSVANQTINFSGYMTSGHGLVRIKVTALKTDFYCILFNQCMQGGWGNPSCSWAFQPNAYQWACPVKTLYQYHNVTGDLQISINGTN